MFSFIVISDVDRLYASVFQAFCAIGTPEEVQNGRLQVEVESEMKNGWIAFQPIDNVGFDYEVDEIKEIRKIIADPYFYLIEGRNGVVNVCDLFINEFCPSGEVLIDNDHGMIVGLEEVKEKARLGEDWIHSIGHLEKPPHSRSW